MTIGIRGTDVWGRANQDADMVCLIEGKIAVSHPRAGAFTMDSPGTFFVAPHAAAPQPVAPVPEGKLRTWAQETETTAGTGVARRAGRWQVVLLRDRYPRASAAATALRDAGFPAHLYRRSDDNYDVSLSDLATAADARACGNGLTGRFGIRSPQVSCRPGQACAREE